MNSTVKSILFWVFILACLVLLWQIVQKSTSNGKDQEISFSTFMDDARQGQVQDVTITNSTVTGHFRNSKDNGFHTTVPANYPDMIKVLREKGWVQETPYTALFQRGIEIGAGHDLT